MATWGAFLGVLGLEGVRRPAKMGQQRWASNDRPGIAENNSSAALRQRCPTASGFVPPIGVYSKATGHFAALGASNGERKH
jgi:hypothetical protein